MIFDLARLARQLKEMTGETVSETDFSLEVNLDIESPVSTFKIVGWFKDYSQWPDIPGWRKQSSKVLDSRIGPDGIWWGLHRCEYVPAPTAEDIQLNNGKFLAEMVRAAKHDSPSIPRDFWGNMADAQENELDEPTS